MHENNISTSGTRCSRGLWLIGFDVVSRWGYNADTLFAPFQLNSEMLADPECRIPTPIANELVKHALKLTGESTLGYHLGTQMRISIHGFIGYAIMTAHEISDALILANRFIQLRMPFYNCFSQLLVKSQSAIAV